MALGGKGPRHLSQEDGRQCARCVDSGNLSCLRLERETARMVRRVDTGGDVYRNAGK